jgi:NAD(P)-dependent dehydrogenase (short-subunit alcohol dehydrogenase family)
MTSFTVYPLPLLNDLVIVITGANSGIGYHAALELSKAGATVVVGSRSKDKADKAIEEIKKQVPNAKLLVPAPLDLADLDSISKFAEAVKRDVQFVDILVNNAGVMGIPNLERTKAGFEMQIGTNHLGHFLLTSRLMPLLRKSSKARVVNVSSIYAQQGRATLADDFTYATSKYTPYGAYGDSKLANLLFTKELQRRVDEAGIKLLAVSVHPGYTSTNLQSSGPQNNKFIIGIVNACFAQSVDRGTLPTLFGVTSPDAKPDGFYGPDGWKEVWGKHVQDAYKQPLALDSELAKKLWEKSASAVKISNFFD